MNLPILNLPQARFECAERFQQHRAGDNAILANRGTCVSVNQLGVSGP